MADDINDGWTVPTLKVHLETRIDDLRLLLDERREAQADALRVALEATEKRFDSVNEFREQLADQTASFSTRGEIRGQFDAVAITLAAVNAKLSDQTQRANDDHQVFSDRVAALELRLSSRLDKGEGVTAGSEKRNYNLREDMTLRLVGAGVLLSFIGSVIAIVLHFIH